MGVTDKQDEIVGKIKELLPESEFFKFKFIPQLRELLSQYVVIDKEAFKEHISNDMIIHPNSSDSNAWYKFYIDAYCNISIKTAQDLYDSLCTNSAKTLNEMAYNLLIYELNKKQGGKKKSTPIKTSPTIPTVPYYTYPNSTEKSPCDGCPYKGGPKDALGNPVMGDSLCDWCSKNPWKVGW